ncbi:flagella synthesis protein FlgN [Paramixta manurensis]|uniref:Flagella synthesis protein FlgN n=1 Tax=Paramixta manurensis TaxID=2740817 RepID=A0A6M8UB21_9GAMM|nr:flagella synthesis protein FlgN [Erwiniaceae bacterium PD-1]
MNVESGALAPQDKHQLVKNLLAGITQDSESYHQLSQLLAKQRTAMIACRAQETEQINQQLMAYYAQLSASSRQRAAALRALNLPGDAQGMRFLISRLPQTLAATIGQRWQSLKQAAQTCQTLNERNGLLLTMQQEVMQSVLGDARETHDYLYSR